MFVRIWQFRARPDRVGEFCEDPFLFVTIDRWESAAAWAAFLRTWGEEYAALDRACEALTVEERDVGTFGHQ